MKSIMRVLVLAAAVLMVSPVVVADQTDERLDDLFEILRDSEDTEQLIATEASIWEIWYQSGKSEIDVLMLQGGDLVRAGELGAAESIYASIIEMAPEFSEGWNRRATVRFYLQDYDGSMQDIEQTLKLEPRHFGAIWGLGMILGIQQDYERAIIAFEKLLEIKPSSSDARPRIELLKQELARQSV